MSFKNNTESVLTYKVEGGKKRTYYLDVKQSRTTDHYLVLTECVKKLDGTTERHKIFIFKEDLNKFLNALQQAGDGMKKLMPDFDFNGYDKQYREYKPSDATGEETEMSW